MWAVTISLPCGAQKYVGTDMIGTLTIDLEVIYLNDENVYQSFNINNIVAAFRGMHVSLAKHSYA